MRRATNSSALICTAILAIAATAGCANGNSGFDRVSSHSRFSNTGLTPPDLGGSGDPFICGSDPEYPEPNVLPKYDRDLTGAGQYIACYARSSLYDIRIHPISSNPPARICAFPVQYVDQSTSFLKPDLVTGRPWSLCSDVTDGKAYFKFDLTSFNAVIVVPEIDRERMTACLENAQGWTCPDYSYGKFR